MKLMEVKKDSLSKWISITHRQFQTYMNKHLKPYGINSSEFTYLMTLGNEDKSFSQEELATMMVLDKAAVTRSIRSLEEKGFVLRCRDENNHRIKRVSLSDKGKEIVPAIGRILDEWDETIKKCIGNDTYDVVTQNLYTMACELIKENS